MGGGAPVVIQSMLNTPTTDVESSLKQIRQLAAAGCQVARLAVPNMEGARGFADICKESPLPLVADIHFDYKLAIAAAEGGAAKIRINPGNIGSDEHVKAVADACRRNSVPIRIGVNSGSVEKSILAKHGAPTAEALVTSALYHASLLERYDFHDIVLSVKASTTREMIAANRILAERTSYPLHLGVTEAGGGTSAIVKSSVGIGALLADGIGDTVRVSLTADPVDEVVAAREILSALGLNTCPKLDIVSCPTCGRTKIDLIRMCEDFRRRIKEEGLDTLPLRVALMGCVVNGPGEARECDFGIAGGSGEGLFFKKGEVVSRVSEDKLVDTLIDELRAYRDNMR